MFVSGQSEVEPTGRVRITHVVLIIVVKTRALSSQLFVSFAACLSMFFIPVYSAEKHLKQGDITFRMC